MIRMRIRLAVASFLIAVFAFLSITVCVVALAVFPPWPALIVSATFGLGLWWVFRRPIERLNGAR